MTARIRSKATIPTFRGGLAGEFDLLNPHPEDVDLGDVAHHIARINRYTGAVFGHGYNVAQHSWLCAAAAGILRPDQQIPCLLHDAREAYIGDDSSPKKRALNALGAGDAYERLDASVHAAVYAKLGCGINYDEEFVHAIDLWAVVIEARHVVNSNTAVMRDAITECTQHALGVLGTEGFGEITRQLGGKLKPWTSTVAEVAFLESYRKYMFARASGVMDCPFARAVDEADKAIAAIKLEAGAANTVAAAYQTHIEDAGKYVSAQALKYAAKQGGIAAPSGGGGAGGPGMPAGGHGGSGISYGGGIRVGKSLIAAHEKQRMIDQYHNMKQQALIDSMQPAGTEAVMISVDEPHKIVEAEKTLLERLTQQLWGSVK